MATPTELKHVPGAELSSQTAQTEGMVREEAISARKAGSTSIWMGRTIVPPRTSSGPHHHGASETCIYVVAGRPVFRYAVDDRERTIEAEPGDYVFVPPFVHHVEENPHEEDAVVVIARSTQEAIVVNLDEL